MKVRVSRIKVAENIIYCNLFFSAKHNDSISIGTVAYDEKTKLYTIPNYTVEYNADINYFAAKLIEKRIEELKKMLNDLTQDLEAFITLKNEEE